MASTDNDADRPEGKVRTRVTADGSGAILPGTVLYDGDGNIYTTSNPVQVEEVDLDLPIRIFALSAAHGESIHLANGAFGGVELIVYDAEVMRWLATAVVGPGSFIPVSAEQAHTGTGSAKWTTPSEGDTLQFAKPVPPEVLAHVAFTFWIFVDAGYGPGNSIEVYGWSGGAVVGTPVAIESKIDQQQQGLWQLVSLTLIELDLVGASIESMRLKYVTKQGLAPTAYIDDMGFQETSGAEEFTIAAPPVPGLIFSLEKIVTVLVDDFAADVVDGTLPGLDPLEFLGGAPLANGLLGELFLGGQPTPVQFVARNNCDFFFQDGRLTGGLSANGNTCVQFTTTFKHAIPLRGLPAGEDIFRLTIRDNMTVYARIASFGLGGFRVA